LRRLFIVVLFVVSITVSAFHMKRESYVDIPTANLKRGLYINVSSSYPIKDVDDVKFDPNFGIDFSYNKFAAALKWYNGVDFSLDLSYQILADSGGSPGLAIGVGEVAVDKYISPAGSDEVFNDENYADRPPEIASAYIVGTKKISENFEFTAGIGRGRFIGYGPRSHLVNVDVFFDENHENWALGVFGGVKVILPNNLSFIIEEDGRDANIGVEYQNELVKGTLALNKLELFTAGEGVELSPRISLNLSYKISGMEERVEKEKKFPLAIELIDNESRESVEGNTVISSQEGDTVGVSSNRKIHSFSLKPNIYIAHIKSEDYIDKDIELPVKRELSGNLYTVELNKKEIMKKIIKVEDSVVIVDNFEDIKNQVEGISIRFPFERADLTPRAHRILDRIIELISTNEDVYLLIIGHTCSLGSDEANQRLSERRAGSVKTYLVGRGIAASKITTEGYGERRPLASNGTEEGRIKNRRAEFILYRMKK
jgi:outer membrane protein OmpA-like peptidoglycan-associated protein